MSRRAFIVTALFFVIGAVVTYPLACQVYEQKRAQAKVPDVLAIADAVRLPESSVLLRDSEVSVNEYSAVVWRYYSTNRSDEDVQVTVKDWAEGSGFDGWKENRTMSGHGFAATKGEFEIRLHLIDSPQDGADFAVGAHWYVGKR